MLVISRFRYDDPGPDGPTASGQAGPTGLAQAELAHCLDQFSVQVGFVRGSVGRAVDDPSLWVLQTQWENVGAYRRALSSYDIKMNVVPLLYRAVDEPSAYEVVVGEGSTEPNESRPRQR